MMVANLRTRNEKESLSHRMWPRRSPLGWCFVVVPEPCVALPWSLSLYCWDCREVEKAPLCEVSPAKPSPKEKLAAIFAEAHLFEGSSLLPHNHLVQESFATNTLPEVLSCSWCKPTILPRGPELLASTHCTAVIVTEATPLLLPVGVMAHL